MNMMKITFSIKLFHILSHVLRRVLSLCKTLRMRSSGRLSFPTFACLCTKTTSALASGTDFHTSTTLLDLWDSSMTVGVVFLCETDTKWVKTVFHNHCGCVVAVHSVREVRFCRVKKNNVMQTMLKEELWDRSHNYKEKVLSDEMKSQNHEMEGHGHGCLSSSAEDKDSKERKDIFKVIPLNPTNVLQITPLKCEKRAMNPQRTLTWISALYRAFLASFSSLFWFCAHSCIVLFHPQHSHQRCVQMQQATVPNSL